MRKCLKCGYWEPLIWRNNPRRMYTQYCRVAELVDWEPEIATALVGKKDIILHGYIYHVVKGGEIVQRIAIEDSATGTTITEPPSEKAATLRWKRLHKRDPQQVKLLECKKK